MSWAPNLCPLAAVGGQAFLPTLRAGRPQNSANLFHACLFWQIKWLHPLTFWWKNIWDRYILLQFLLKKKNKKKTNLFVAYFDSKRRQQTHFLLAVLIAAQPQQARCPALFKMRFRPAAPTAPLPHSQHRVARPTASHIVKQVLFHRQKRQSTDKLDSLNQLNKQKSRTGIRALRFPVFF